VGSAAATPGMGRRFSASQNMISTDYPNGGGSHKVVAENASRRGESSMPTMKALYGLSGLDVAAAVNLKSSGSLIVHLPPMAAHFAEEES